MPLVYITGISGSGKSSVRDELIRRGYEVYGTDEDDLAYFYNDITGERVTKHATAQVRTPEWRAQHSWKLPRAKLNQLVTDSEGKLVFITGVTANDADELWDLFSRVFALSVDEETLRKRIAVRKGNDFGKSKHELGAILAWQKTADDDYQKLGATIIDANRPLHVVVDDILEKMRNCQLSAHCDIK